MADLHEAVFRWRQTDANEVILTGTFDQWSKSIYLVRDATGFGGAVRIPWESPVQYKFIVDGQWRTSDDHPTQPDPSGNINNFYIAPKKPPPPTVDAPPAVLPLVVVEPTPAATISEPTEASASPIGTLSGKISEIADHVQSAVVAPVIVAVSSAISSTSTEKPAAPAVESAKGVLTPEVENGHAGDAAISSGIPAPPNDSTSGATGSRLTQVISDVADTVLAREGTSSATSYVASGLGATIHNVIGVDPINLDKIPVEATVPAEQTEPQVEQNPVSDERPAPKLKPVIAPGPVASKVPVSIIPVNDASQNTPEPAASAISPVSVQGSSPSTHTPTSPVPGSATNEVADDVPVATRAPQEAVVVGKGKEREVEPVTPTDPVSSTTAQPTEVAEGISGEAPTVVITSATEQTIENNVEPPASATAQDIPPVTAEETQVNGSTVTGAPTTTAMASVNGQDVASDFSEKPNSISTTQLSTAPTTPTKSKFEAFPSTQTPSGSPSSSKHGTNTSARKKRTSILGKIKHIFHGDKEKEHEKR